MKYTPFNKDLSSVSSGELATLREVMEGWYVEYKADLIATRGLAKSLSSFANQYGGWLFLGVEEDRKSRTAGAFPGVDNERVNEVLDELRNAAKDIVRPQVSYQSRIFNGPIGEIGLESGRSVIAVYVPEGSNTPYIHNDGRIYIRIGDSSSPTPVTDKATFDLLYQRGEDRRAYLADLVERAPQLSKDEEDSSFVHLSILSDPYGTLGYRYRGSYGDFCTAMASHEMPFDNFYTAPDGFVARQVGRNRRYYRLMTWEFASDCNSFVSIPIPRLPIHEHRSIFELEMIDRWRPYTVGEEFAFRLIDEGLGSSRILNLNLMLFVLPAIIRRHRMLVAEAGVTGPLYMKAYLENVWRTVPFLDLREYVDHVTRFDFPIVQVSNMLVPKGTSLETFVTLPERRELQEPGGAAYMDDFVNIWLDVMGGFGIPGSFLAGNATRLVCVAEAESARSRND